MAVERRKSLVLNLTFYATDLDNQVRQTSFLTVRW